MGAAGIDYRSAESRRPISSDASYCYWCFLNWGRHTFTTQSSEQSKSIQGCLNLTLRENLLLSGPSPKLLKGFPNVLIIAISLLRSKGMKICKSFKRPTLISYEMDILKAFIIVNLSETIIKRNPL